MVFIRYCGMVMRFAQAMSHCESKKVSFCLLFQSIMRCRFRAPLTDQLERIMRKVLFATLIGACFVMGGGIAGASFIRYVAAPGVVMADRTTPDSRVEQAAELAYGPVQKADDGACSAEVAV
jgi:hypothetical protein